MVRKGIEPKSQAAIVFTGPFPFDTPHEVALDALGIVLESRLRRSLSEALRGTYGVEVEANAVKIPEPRYSVTIEFGCDPERTEELVATLLREIERLKAEGPTESEVADAREALMVAYQTDMAQNNRLADRLVRALPVSRGRGGVLQPACRVPEARHPGDPGRRQAVSRHRQLRAGHAVPGGRGGREEVGRPFRLAAVARTAADGPS